MRGTLNAKKRRQFNRGLPEVQAMLASAERYGPSRGVDHDTQTIMRILQDLEDLGFGNLPTDFTSFAGRLAADPGASSYQIAVNVVWGLASMLSNKDCLDLNKDLTSHGIDLGATVFSDEFRERMRTAVLGRRVWMWRTPAAYAALLLMTLSDASDERTSPN